MNKMKSTVETKVIDTFNYLHENAEISWEEVNTTKYIKETLEKYGCETITFEQSTGVIGKYGDFSKGLPVVAIRADIDALWQEVDGKFQPNHSCGHDAHMAMVLGVLWKLKEKPGLEENVAIKFIFQPAEEVGEGALKMVEEGAVDDVDYLYGVHLRPIEETAMGSAAPVIVHGATKTIEVQVAGADAHGARPHLNTNAIEVGTEIVNLLSKIHLDPRIPHSAKMTKFEAGGKSANIIPGSGSFSFDLRAQNNEVMEELVGKVHAIFESIRNLYDIKLEVTKERGIAAAKTNEEAISIMGKSIENVLGVDKVDAPLVTPGGDDFHFYTIKKPSLKATMLGLGCDLAPGLHHPKMTFNTEALINGVDILFDAIIQTYEQHKK
ncbi:M20 peptidase aminoacylase family protein [Sporosarcina soli]|uniref:M20 peptidase aminoacylase family protein n=1 Tax=Sporosarcina soli TaxID=334736 RepID=A0ABW0TK83_9BACL